MNKRIYRAFNVKQVDWLKLSAAVEHKSLVFSIDVAKEEQYAMLMDKEHTTYLTVKWMHPADTEFLLEHLRSLPANQLEMAMEPTGVYGDTLRMQLTLWGYRTFQVPAKRVNDAAEIYDGVPSLHDAKSAYIIGRLYWDGIGRPWVESTRQQREMDALCQLYAYHDGQYAANRNRLEALLHRHWPELPQHLGLDSVTLESLLIHYGDPRALALNSEEAKAFMKRISRGKLSAIKIQAIVDSSAQTIGIPCIKAERWQLQQRGEELQRSRLKKKEIGSKLEAWIESDADICHMGNVIGKIGTAMLLGNRLDPRDYSNAHSYRKAMGLNLKEKSSGKFKGQLKLTKRGSSQARKYLYLACLRLLQHDPVIRRWYETQVLSNGNKHKIKIITALMRKIALALWHVGRGECFDANKLFSLETGI